MKTLKYAIRFLTRSKSYTLINLLGLAFSLACCIILMRYIHRELTVDTHCVDREQVYAIQKTIEGNHYLGDIGNQGQDSICIPESAIDMRTSIRILENDHIVYQDYRYTCHAIATDSSYFRLFPYQAAQGALSLSTPESALLTKNFADKLFGKENPIGKTIRYSNGKELVVKGILKEPSNKRSIQFDMILSNNLNGTWDRVPIEFFHFTTASEKQKAEQSGKYPRYINPHATQYDTRQFTFSVIPIKDIYWNQSLIKQTYPDMGVCGNRLYLHVLEAICVLILLAGIINFVNLYLAIMHKRSKIYMLRRVFGANGRALFNHIYTENALLIVAALFFAWLFIEVTQIPVGRLLDTQFVYTPFDAWISLGFLCLLPLSISLYAFWQCQRKLPIDSIRGIGVTNHRLGTRMVFLFTQYAITFLLVIVSLYFNKHLRFLLDTDPGIRTEDVIEAKLIYESNDYSTYNSEIIQERQKRIAHIENMLNQCPDIEVWTAVPWYVLGFDYLTNFSKGEGGGMYNMNQMLVTPEFFQIFEIPVLEGTIPKTHSNDRTNYLIANRTAMKTLGYTTCEGAALINEDMRRFMPQTQSTVISAVVEDYFDRHISEGIRPIVFNMTNYNNGDVYQIACQKGKTQSVVDYLKKVEKEVYGSEDFEYSLVSERIKKLYEEDKRIADIYATFAGIAILIICLGLFGISLFDIRQRYREIAIRKAHGAGMKDLYQLLFRKYLLVLGASFVVAVPLAYYLIHQYTADFVVKAPIGIGIFVIALLLVALISMGTLWWQIRKAANIDPATVMKSE